MRAGAARGVGGPLEDYRNPARQHLAFFHASTCQGARWRFFGLSGSYQSGAITRHRIGQVWTRRPVAEASNPTTEAGAGAARSPRIRSL